MEMGRPAAMPSNQFWSIIGTNGCTTNNADTKKDETQRFKVFRRAKRRGGVSLS